MLLTGIREISTKQYQTMIDFTIRRGGNLMVFGLGGTGKTEIAKSEVHHQLGRSPIYVNLSVMEAPDLLGLPYRDEKTNTSRYSPPSFIPLLSRTPEPQVMLFDEIDKAKPELQNPLLEIFQFHTLNGEPLNIKGVIATANLPDEGAFSKPISGPLANRCAIFKTQVVFDEWQAWASANQVNSLVVGYLSKNSEFLSQSPDKTDRTAYARPSPRSWTNTAHDLDAWVTDMKGNIESPDAVDHLTMLVAGRVGEPAALQFRVWLEHYRHIAGFVDALVARGDQPPANMPIDRLLVCALAACGEVAKAYTGKRAGSPESKKLTERVFSWVRTLAPEIQIGAVKSTMTTAMFIRNELMKIAEVKDVFNSISTVLGMKKAETA